MALIFMDGFDWFPTGLNGTNMGDRVSRLWPGTAFNSSDGSETGARGAGTSVSWNNSTLGGRELKTRTDLRPLSHANNEIYVGFYYKTPAASWIGNRDLLQIYSDTISDAQSVGLYTNSGNSTLDVRRGTSNVGTAVVTGMTLDTWHHIEVYFNMLDSGQCIIRVDGVEVYDSGVADFQPSGDSTKTWQHVRLGQWGTQSNIDDVFIMDGSGTDFNDFIGPQYIETLFPDGDGNSTDWTDSASAGTNYYQMIDETDVDDDTTYLSSSTSTDETLSTMENATLTSDAPKAVSHHVDIRVDVGSTDVTLSARGDSTTVQSSSFTISDTDYYQEFVIHEVNPIDSSAWTTADFDAMEFGVKIV